MDRIVDEQFDLTSVLKINSLEKRINQIYLVLEEIDQKTKLQLENMPVTDTNKAQKRAKSQIILPKSKNDMKYRINT